MSEKRWCFRKDDDGHNYLIPAEMGQKFRDDMEVAYVTDDFGGVEWVDQYCCDSPEGFTFTAPEAQR